MGQCQTSVDCDPGKPAFISTEKISACKAETLINNQPTIDACGEQILTHRSCTECSQPKVATYLRDYFNSGYLDGELYKGPNYDGHCDEELGDALLRHDRSGIVVWNEALDLRMSAASDSAEVLFHYTTRDVFAAAVRSDPDPTALIKLLTTDVCSDFGPGLLANASEPDQFGYKDDVILNNHWPRIADPKIFDRTHETWLLESGDSAAGPGDSQNWMVVDAILGNPDNQGKADFCIPLIVPQCFIFDIWNRWPMQTRETTAITAVEAEGGEEVEKVGCNRWGDKQWKGRDICMVHMKVEEKSMLAEAVQESRLEIVNKRIVHLEGTKGHTHPETVAFLEYFAVLLHRLGRYNDAVEPLKQAVDSRFAVFGESDSKTLATLRCLGRSLQEAGRLEEAEEVFRRILQGCKDKFGPDDPTSVVALSDLAALVQAAGKHDLAIDLLEEALQRRESMLDSWPQDWEMMVLKKNFAKLLQRQDRHEQAEVLLRDVLDFAVHSVADPLDIVVLQPHLDLAKLMKAMGDNVRAEGILRRALAVCEAKLEKNHHETLGCLEELAVVLQHMREQAEAEEYLQRVVDGREQTQGENHPDTLAALDNLAMCLKAHGKHTAAVPLLRSVLERTEQALGTEHPSTLAAIVELAMVLPAAENNGELELLLRRALEVWQLQGKPALESRFAEPNHAMMVVAAAVDGARYAATSLDSWRTAGIKEQDLSKVIEAHLYIEAVAGEQEHGSTQVDGTLSHSESGIEEQDLSRVIETHFDIVAVAGEQESATSRVEGNLSHNEARIQGCPCTVPEAHLDKGTVAGEQEHASFPVDGTSSHREA